MFNRQVAVGVAVLLCLGLVSAQVSYGGKPTDPSRLPALLNVDTKVMAGFDVHSLLLEDAVAPKDVPYRFAYGIPVNYTLDNAGSWSTLEDGTKVWRLRVESAGALSLNFVFSEFYLNPGNQLFIYDLSRTFVLGSFTWENNKPNRQFATQPVYGEAVVLELVVLPGSKPGVMTLSIVNHAYRSFEVLGYGDSGICNVNTICPEGDAWRDQIRSIGMILTSSGSRLCSGALINNARNDGRQLFLTAYHCITSDINNWVVVFNYASPTCPRNQQRDGSTADSVQGTRTLSSGRNSDYVLVELSERIPASYSVYYSGFNANDSPAATATGLHHPSGDIKKYCYSGQATKSSSWPGSDANSHWLVAKWDIATTEPGSSGSPLYDQNKRIVGQLHGGEATCSYQFNDYYGKLSRSYDAGLKTYLDPDNTGARIADGRNA